MKWIYKRVGVNHLDMVVIHDRAICIQIGRKKNTRSFIEWVEPAEQEGVDQ